MLLNMLKGKIHRATVVQAELDYVGSITVDEDLMDAAGIREYEQVQIVDVNNGQRFETYVIAGERGSGMICLKGDAARCVSVGDKVIIMCYALMTEEEVAANPPPSYNRQRRFHVWKDCPCISRLTKNCRITCGKRTTQALP